MTDAAPMEQLRRRRSGKWTTHPPDVLPMFLAEMDFPLAPAITAALQRALADGDTGYVDPHDTGAAEAYAAYARQAWGWEVDPAWTSCTTDVSVVVVESLRRLVAPGDGVVITSPVYPPFPDLVTEAGATVVDVPLLDDGREYRLDLDGIDRALAAGARAVLLCNPHNPVGRVHSREELTALSRVVARHGAAVVSDEIHAPLTHRGVEFTPYLTVSDEARDHGIAACSGSKAFNLAGLKAALFVAGSERTAALVRSLPEEVAYRAGHFGVLATRAGFTDGLDWLDGVLATVEGNVELLRRELAEHLPQAHLRTPSATYLAWLDLRGLGWGDDPARHALEHGRLALSNGPAFGPGGAGFARVNLACAPGTVREAVARLVRAREVPARP